VNPAKKHAVWIPDEDRFLHDRLSRNSTTKGLTEASHNKTGPTRSEGAISVRNTTTRAWMESEDVWFGDRSEWQEVKLRR
jgi:hypothetical protein